MEVDGCILPCDIEVYLRYILLYIIHVSLTDMLLNIDILFLELSF